MYAQLHTFQHERGKMMTKKQKQIRPKAAARLPLSLRVTPAVRNALTLASHNMGRSVSQEAETRLELSFYFESLLPDVLHLAYGNRIGGLLLAIGEAMKEAVKRAPEDANNPWHENPWVYDQVASSVAETLRLARPGGEAIQPANPHPGVLDEHHEAQTKFGAPSARFKAGDIVQPPDLDPNSVRLSNAIRAMLGPTMMQRITEQLARAKKS
jgi:hypothetical protein